MRKILQDSLIQSYIQSHNLSSVQQSFIHLQNTVYFNIVKIKLLRRLKCVKFISPKLWECGFMSCLWEVSSHGRIGLTDNLSRCKLSHCNFPLQIQDMMPTECYQTISTPCKLLPCCDTLHRWTKLMKYQAMLSLLILQWLHTFQALFVLYRYRCSYYC